MKHRPPVIGALVAVFRLGFNVWSTAAEMNGFSNSRSQWTTLDTNYISKCKEGIRMLVFLASILYGTLAFLMEDKI